MLLTLNVAQEFPSFSGYALKLTIERTEIRDWMQNIIVEQLHQTPVRKQKVEIVERKGRGHPDYIADSACEAVSRSICKYYKEEFGMILHHNVDKGLVVGGRANPVFGGGEVIEPINIIVAGRAVTEVVKDGRIISVPISTISIQAIRSWLESNFRFLDVDHHVIIQPMIRRGSADLIELFKRGKEVPLANDTSFGVCFAPLTESEKITLEIEQFLNSPKQKKELPEVGEDVKVLTYRKENELDITISAAIISKLTPDLSHYMSVKEQIESKVSDLVVKLTDMPFRVHVNTADKPEEKIIYLTVTGTSAEAGDDGNTGRSNRVNGLITPCRQMSLEATAGKNPVNHVGKIYNVVAKLIANRIYEEVNGVEEVYVKILSQIGRPINQPLLTSIQAIPEEGYSLSQLKSDMISIASEELDNVHRITDMILRGDVLLF